MSSTVELFGGALTATFPGQRCDASELREIPDNQEVFVHTSTDQSIIVEVMEYQQAEDDTQALRTYFEDLAQANSSQSDAKSYSYRSLELSSLAASQCSACCLMKGTQQIKKFKDSASNTIEVNMAVLRLPQFTSDIIITFNNTQLISENSSSKELDPSNGEHGWTAEDFQTIVTSLKIINEGLFG